MTKLATFEHTYADDVPELVVATDPVPVTSPRLVLRNRDLERLLGVPDDLDDDELARLLAGNEVPDQSTPVAQAYAGHQFGQYNPQLGDGRAVLLGEVVGADGVRRDVALKGSGRTPFSRGGDGRASLGPVLREHLMGEAMHALGVPTTRALASVTTGETIRRQQPEPGAVLTRVAASHLRVGTFQFAAARGGQAVLAKLVDHALDRHGPGIEEVADGNRALALLDATLGRQAALVAQWMHLGFIHGVMNTDNTTISGETIDYGPCAFMEAHDPSAVFSSIDHGGRYASRNQPGIALWNMARLAEALLPLVDDDTDTAVTAVTEVLDTFGDRYRDEWLAIARRKLGAPTADLELAMDFESLMTAAAADHTLTWRALADAAAGDDAGLRRHLTAADGDTNLAAVADWLGRWDEVVDRADESVARMRATSPVVVPRNHLVEEALDAAHDDDLAPFRALLAAVTSPFDAPADERFTQPAPAAFTDAYVTYCGT